MCGCCATRDPVKDWSRGRTTLLGDAAHPMLQYLAQGACMAIEDGVVLAETLKASGGDVPAAFQTYQEARYLRTGKCQMMARLYGEFYHADGVKRELRNQMLAGRTPEQSFDGVAWLYEGGLRKPGVPTGIAAKASLASISVAAALRAAETSATWSDPSAPSGITKPRLASDRSFRIVQRGGDAGHPLVQFARRHAHPIAAQAPQRRLDGFPVRCEPGRGHFHTVRLMKAPDEPSGQMRQDRLGGGAPVQRHWTAALVADDAGGAIQEFLVDAHHLVSEQAAEQQDAGHADLANDGLHDRLRDLDQRGPTAWSGDPTGQWPDQAHSGRSQTRK